MCVCVCDQSFLLHPKRGMLGPFYVILCRAPVLLFSGDYQSVTTTTLPGGSSVTSTSFSGPAAAAAAPASTAAAAVAGDQPNIAPYANREGNAATVSVRHLRGLFTL